MSPRLYRRVTVGWPATALVTIGHRGAVVSEMTGQCNDGKVGRLAFSDSMRC
jgi:hypothetical protein